MRDDDMPFTNRFLPLAIILLCLLTACEKSKQTPTEPATAQSPESNSSAVTKPSVDQVVKTPADKINNPEVINFTGFGPAKFGDNEESVRMSWGRPLTAGKPAEGATCYYLYLDPKPDKHQEIAFMFEDGKFVRYDIDDPKWAAPGNIVVGDTMEKVMQAHAGHIESQPHKYIEGAHTLVVTPPVLKPGEKPNASLIIETDANNIVTKWRIGVSPQVFYVEGCS